MCFKLVEQNKIFEKFDPYQMVELFGLSWVDQKRPVRTSRH